jgi:Flp pilus assembly pilin Flp
MAVCFHRRQTGLREPGQSALNGEEDLHMSDILIRPIIAMQVAVHQLRQREDGQTTTEYAILLGFLAIAIIIALFFLRGVLRSLFSNAASSVSRAPNS